MTAWKKHDNADAYVNGVRAAIPLLKEQLALAHRLIEATLPSVTHLLDLGCGDGALSESVLAHHPGASAVLVDFSDPMLARARQRFAGSGRATTILQADFGQRSWTDVLPAGERYDLVVSGYAIHHLQDEEKRLLFGDVFECLRPGGLFLNLEHVTSRSPLGRELFDKLFIDSLFDYALTSDPAAQCSEIAATYHGREDQHDNHLAPVDEQCGWLRESGFVDVDCYFKLLELALIAGRKPERS